MFSEEDFATMQNVEKAVCALFLALVVALAGLVLANSFVGTLYDTDHFADTFFMLGAGWRVFNGLTPVIDFGHFYGGMVEQGIGATMHVFGPSAFVFDYFTLLLLAAFALASLAILYNRISPAGIAAVILTIATLLLTRYPLELNEPVIRVVSTHSFLYNRIGLALFLLSGLYVALRTGSERADLLPGALVGVLLVLAALIKPTFAVLAPGILLGLAVQQRWHGLGTVIAGMVVAILILDPMLARFSGSLSYAEAHVGAEPSAQLTAVLRKAIQVPLSQPVATTLALVALIFMAMSPAHRTAALGTLIVAAAGVGMTTTMGGNGSLGQLALPVAIMIALAAAESARGAALKESAAPRAMAFALVIAFAMPHALNLAAATTEGISRGDRLLISEGPYARYLSLPEQMEEGVPSQYEMLADGIAALHSLGDPSRWGIVADSGITFEHAVLGRPVPGYPLWQRVTAPELAPDRPLAPEVNIVMIGEGGRPGSVGALLEDKLGEDFIVCATTKHWEIRARLSSGIVCPGVGR